MGNVINNTDLLICFFAILGGLIRITLNIDSTINQYRQFILLIIAAMPSGYFVAQFAIINGFHKSAYPVSFIIGIMALSIVTIIAEKGAKEFVKIMCIIVNKSLNKIFGNKENGSDLK